MRGRLILSVVVLATAAVCQGVAIEGEALTRFSHLRSVDQRKSRALHEEGEDAEPPVLGSEAEDPDDSSTVPTPNDEDDEEGSDQETVDTAEGVEAEGEDAGPGDDIPETAGDGPGIDGDDENGNTGDGLGGSDEDLDAGVDVAGEDDGSTGEQVEPEGDGNENGVSPPEDKVEEGADGDDATATPTPAPSNPPKAAATDAPSAHTERDDVFDKGEVESAGWFGGLFALSAMIFTAWQMSDNPDGIYAATCRLIITILGLLCRIVTTPCRVYCGGGQNQRYGGHMPVSTMDYGYKDPSLELA